MPSSPSGLRAMCSPKPSLIFECQNGGALWASGIFPGFGKWMQSHVDVLVTTCREASRTRVATKVHIVVGRVEKYDEETFEQKLNDVVRVVLDVLTAIAGGRRVAVHCVRGIHRTGVVVVLLLSLLGLLDCDECHSWETWVLDTQTFFCKVHAKRPQT